MHYCGYMTRTQQGLISVLLLLLIVIAAIGGIFYYGVMNGNLLKTSDPDLNTTRKFDEQMKKDPTTVTLNPTQSPYCHPKFEVTSGPELTTSEAYAGACLREQSKINCEKVDVYNAKDNNFGNSDGIPDCEWK